MNIFPMIATYVTALIFFLAVDAVWLGFIARRFYAGQLGDLMRQSPNLQVAAVFYAVYVIGLVYFAIWPARLEGSAGTAFFNGALLGLIAYGTYDMTNLATVRDWPWRLSLVDWTWGTILTGTTALVAYWISQRWWGPAAG